MTRKTLTGSVFALLACALATALTSTAQAQTPEMPKPGPEHKMLAKLAGTWDAACTMCDGTQSKGVMTYKMDLGGFWLLGEFEGTFAGEAFKGRAVDGYDQFKKKYVSIWTDSMGSWPMIMEGSFDDKTNTMTMTTQGPGPDGKTLTTFKTVCVMKDDNHFDWKMTTTMPDGKEQTMISISYTRRTTK